MKLSLAFLLIYLETSKIQASTCTNSGTLSVTPSVAPFRQPANLQISASALNTSFCDLGNLPNVTVSDNYGTSFPCFITGCLGNVLKCILPSPSSATSALTAAVSGVCSDPGNSTIQCPCHFSGDLASGSIFFGQSSPKITFYISDELSVASFQRGVSALLRLPDSNIVWISGTPNLFCSGHLGTSKTCFSDDWNFLSTASLPFAHTAYISTLTSKLSSGSVSLFNTSVLRAQIGSDCWYLDSSVNVSPKFAAVRLFAVNVTIWFTNPSDFQCVNSSLPVVHIGTTVCYSVSCDPYNPSVLHCIASEQTSASVSVSISTNSAQCGLSGVGTCQSCTLGGKNATFLWGEPSANVNFTVLLATGSWSTDLFRLKLSPAIGLDSPDQIMIRSNSWCGSVCSLLSIYILPTLEQPLAPTQALEKLISLAKDLSALSAILGLPIASVVIGEDTVDPTEGRITTPLSTRGSNGGDSLILLKILLPAFGSLAVIAAVFSGWAVAVGLKRRRCFLCVIGDVVSTRSSLKTPCKTCTDKLKADGAVVLLCEVCLNRGTKGAGVRRVCTTREQVMDDASLLPSGFDPLAKHTLCPNDEPVYAAFYCLKGHHFAHECERAPNMGKHRGLQCLSCRDKVLEKKIVSPAAASAKSDETELMVLSNAVGVFPEKDERSSNSASPDTLPRATSSEDIMCEPLPDQKDFVLVSNPKRSAIQSSPCSSQPTHRLEKLTPLTQDTPSPSTAAPSATSSPLLSGIQTPDHNSFSGNKRSRTVIETISNVGDPDIDIYFSDGGSMGGRESIASASKTVVGRDGTEPQSNTILFRLREEEDEETSAFFRDSKLSEQFEEAAVDMDAAGPAQLLHQMLFSGERQDSETQFLLLGQPPEEGEHGNFDFIFQDEDDTQRHSPHQFI